MNGFAKNIAVIGCGYWGQNLVRSMNDIGALRAVSDSDTARAADFSGKYAVPSLSFEDTLANPEISGIVLAVPAPAHAAMTLRALEAGKHVFVEKPLALKLDDAQAMITAAEKAGRILMVGHVLQYHPAFVALQAMVTAGTLGDLRHIRSSRLNFGKVRTEENVFWSFAPHDISMILALSGRTPCDVKAVAGAGIDGSTLASSFSAHLDFGHELRADIHVSWLNPFKEQKLTVVGTKGMAVFDDTLDWDRKLTLYANSVSFRDGQPILAKADAQAIPLLKGEPLREECAHFAACMADGTIPRTDGHEALRVLNVMQACDRAAGLA